MEKKIRVVPHVEGNFPSYVFIRCIPTDPVIEAAEQIIKSNNLIKIPFEDWHISLSKPLYLKHFQLEPFYKRLSEKLKHMKRFKYSLCSDVISMFSEGADVFYHGFKVNIGKDKVFHAIIGNKNR